MTLTDRINEDIKTAMKAREQTKLAALRDIKSKLLLELTKEGATGEVDEATGMRVLNKLAKQRMEAAELYKQQGREDLYQEEIDQAEVIKVYLPKAMDEAELMTLVKDIITQTGASSMADMGKVMGMASAKAAGRADGKTISAVVKSILGA